MQLVAAKIVFSLASWLQVAYVVSIIAFGEKPSLCEETIKNLSGFGNDSNCLKFPVLIL